MNISWGKITIYTRPYKSGAYGSSDTWTQLSIPVDGSTNLSINEGDTKEAKQEGGELVDSITGANTYEFVFKLFVKKTDISAYPSQLEAINGVVAGEHAFKAIPEDPQCYGMDMPRASVRCVENYTSADGITLEYHCKAILDDATGAGHYNNGRLVNIEKLSANAGSVSLSANELSFSSAEDTDGQAVIVNCPNAFTAASSETFATVDAIGNAVVVTVSENTGSSARTATVTVTDSVTGNTATIEVTQSA